MIVLSLFDGMSCGRVALSKAGIPISQYYASEIDKHAIKVAQKNWSDTVQLGDVKVVRQMIEAGVMGKVDLLIGGSPCQGFSFAGKQLAFNDPRSALFFEFVNILNLLRQKNPNIKFLLENVKMKKEHLEVITAFLGVQPVKINSALVSAQNRVRYYWCNWKVEQPLDRGIYLRDIIEDGVNVENLVDTGQLNRLLTSSDVEKSFSKINPEKAAAMTARQYSNWKGNFVTCKETPEKLININPSGNGMNGWVYGVDAKSPTLTTNKGEGLKITDKSYCLLATMHKENVKSLLKRKKVGYLVPETEITYRKLTPVECERLQGLPDDYTSAVSNSQRYKMLGNGWQVDTVEHIFQGMFK